jgi:hypothetical protein
VAELDAVAAVDAIVAAAVVVDVAVVDLEEFVLADDVATFAFEGASEATE